MKYQQEEHATAKEREYMEAYELYGSYAEAGKHLGVSPDAIRNGLNRFKKRLASLGHAPNHFDSGVAPGYVMGKVTVQRNSLGEVERTWERQSPEDQRRQEALKEAYEAMAEALPRQAPVKPPEVFQEDLLTLYTLTDCHVGMRAWAKETGDDWDLTIAEDTLVGCFEQMINASPSSQIGLVNQLGDFLHYDSLLPLTPTSGHVVDADSRFSKMASTAVRILRRVINRALEKHQKVVVILAEGNHDITSSVWLRVMFQALYENEPRVQVIDSELPYYTYVHGKTLLAFHHGHLKKNDQLPLLFAAQFPKQWGDTVYRYCHTGHRHHLEEKEHSGMYVVQHATIAARDAYAARGGWQSNRQVTSIIYHSEFGQVSRNTIVPEMMA